ncbi:hypothetical protein APSETT445_002919 [Aspergillus pseudonomiae]
MPESTGTPDAPDHQILPTGTHSDTPKPLQAGQAYEPGLRRVPDRIPWVVALIIVVELGERFTYFGLSGPLQNYIKNPYAPGADLPGALGKGQAVASALGNFFKFWAYASTILGAVVADQYVGKFKAIVIASGIYIVGLTILVATATPAAINGGSAFGGLVASMVIIGLGTGGIKANVTPFCAEQYNKGSAFVKTLKSGERVVVDPELTVERMFMWFYWAVNIGALSPLITVNVEAKAGQMALHGTPNDLLQNLDPIALIIFIPFLDLVVYPALRHFKIDFRPELKITVGFFMASMSMVYASVLQHYIYISPAQTIHVWVQTPAYVLVAFSEAFVVVTGLEIAYTSAPERAGIIGLNVALELSKRGYGQHITVMAEHLPGDESIDYTSPWAGANFSGISGSDANALRWDRSGYLAMMRLIDTEAEEAKYLSKTESTEYWDQAPSQDKIISMTEYLHDLVIIPPSDLPEGVAFGIRFTTVTLNAPAHCEYLKYLLSQPRYGGIKFVRRKVSSLQDAFLYGTQIVFNCIGNAASSLAGVADLKCYPTRGQIILVKAPSVRVNVMRHGKDYETYIIPRPRSDGTVILGGYLQPGDQTRQTRPVETESILSRTEGLLPILKNGETEILHVAVGLRPSRQGGARVELETTPEGHTVVHNYGAGGTGFQAGMGMAKDAVDLASDILSQLRAQSASNGENASSDRRTNESPDFTSLVQPTDSTAMPMTEGPLYDNASRVGEQLYDDFSLIQGLEDPHASDLGGGDHGIMDELMLSIYEGQGLSHIEPNPAPGPPSLDNHPSLTSQLCGLTGDMDPYVLRHYRFDARAEFPFSKLAIRSAQDVEVPVQFLLSKPELSYESKAITSLEGPFTREGLPELSQIVTPDIGERLIQL